MASYHYSPQLPAPANWTSIDFAEPRMAPAIELLKNKLRQELKAFIPPQNVKQYTETIRSFDGEYISCLVFEPTEQAEHRPAMLYCHGGGFFLPIQPMMVKLAAQYAEALEARIFLPEYRILPDYPAPYPFRDCLSVWQWMQKNTEAPEKLLIYGESVGGTLAAGLALWQRENPGQQPAGLCLIYPALDRRFSRYPSMLKYSEAAWPLKNNISMWQQYLREKSPETERFLIPMQNEAVSGLPETYIEAEEIDILHDEAEVFAEQLSKAGVSVHFADIPGCYHGFDCHTENHFVQKIVKQRIAVMRQMLSK